MDAGKKTVFDIFNGGQILEVPFFQRSYVWGEEQWERMLDDLEFAQETNTPYFMGSVILKQRLVPTSAGTGTVRTIIDGQQRLTTLSILMKVLCIKKDEMGKFDRSFRLYDGRTVIQHNHIDMDAYTKAMNAKALNEIEDDNAISAAFRYFWEHLCIDKLTYEGVCNLIQFVGIDLNYDEDEQQIFDTINSLGVRLTTAELLKNYFFEGNRLDDYNRYWLNTFEKDEEIRAYWDQEITTGRLKRTFIDLFFDAYLQIKEQERELGVTAEHKKLFVKADRLFDSYKFFIKTYLGGDKQKILKELPEYAEIFRKTFDVNVINCTLPQEASLERINVIIFALDTSTLIPYLLYIEKNVKDKEERKRIYQYLESYTMRRIVTRASNKNYNQLFTDRLITNQILTAQGLMGYFNNADDQYNQMPTDEKVLEAFHKSWLTNKYAAGVLYMIESATREPRYHATQLLGFSKYSLEHMMPKKWRNHWPFDGDEQQKRARDDKLLTLGNLAIITQSLNTSIRDASWRDKVNGKGDRGGLRIYSTGIETLAKYLDFSEWNEETIDQRAEDLYNRAMLIWGKDVADQNGD